MKPKGIRWAKNREAGLQPKQNQEKPARIPLVVTYHPILPSFHMIPKRHLPILHVSERLRKVFRYPPLISFRHPKNLKDFLVRATLTSNPSEPSGNYTCRAPRCKTCPILRVTDEFSSHTTGQFFKVKFHASCKSSNIVYLITCRRCGLQYVGENESTTPCKDQWSSFWYHAQEDWRVPCGWSL